MDSGKQQVVLVDPNTKETYKVFVNIKDVARIESDSCYRQKVLTDIIKTKNASSCLKPNAIAGSMPDILTLVLSMLAFLFETYKDAGKDFRQSYEFPTYTWFLNSSTNLK
ncbi:hypothetical protein TSAR_009856 [Trichomalopsis sarcophagae]|uniref:Uncharacterized protein n=1 Tax=Trichomalopsis sarcophagae TaxID=543379 RepID=A0A232EG18_9HYME|nr:hypothetical protein TSAR_009856 [Trichomalopsis sarcophagae]